MKRLGFALFAVSLLFSGCAHTDAVRDCRNQQMVSAVEGIPIGTPITTVISVLADYSVQYQIENYDHIYGTLVNVGPSNSLTQADVAFDFHFDPAGRLASKNFKKLPTGM